MRKLSVVIGLVAAMPLSGRRCVEGRSADLKSATANLPGVAKNYSSINQIACRG